MVDTRAQQECEVSYTPGVYKSLGVRTIINARGATTAVGGSLMPPEVLEAMRDAAGAFVVLEELNAKVGQKIAAATGAEAGYVTSGSAAGMALAAAACIAGTDPARIRRLPDTSGLANQIVVHRTHRIRYDQMFRLAGARLIEIGYPQGTERWELESAINEETAAIAYHDSPAVGPTALDFETVVAVAKERAVPVIVDAASTLPPVDHLRRWIRRGADLVCYSGGKGIRGPQESGMLAGRSDLIAAATANGAPNVGIGRGMKVSKEAMVGLSVALDLFLNRDHDQDFAAHLEQAELLRMELGGCEDFRVEVISDIERFPAPVVIVSSTTGSWNSAAVRDALLSGDPPIHTNVELGGLAVHTHCLLPGDERQIAHRVRTILDPGS